VSLKRPEAASAMPDPRECATRSVGVGVEDDAEVSEVVESDAGEVGEWKVGAAAAVAAEAAEEEAVAAEAEGNHISSMSSPSNPTSMMSLYAAERGRWSLNPQPGGSRHTHSIPLCARSGARVS
jgi:hypothetical protein